MILRRLGYRYSGAHVFTVSPLCCILLQAKSLLSTERYLGLLDYAEALKLATAITADPARR